MYYTHDLRSNLQEWRNRLYKATYSQFGSQFIFFFKSIDNEPILKGLIDEATTKFNIDRVYVERWLKNKGKDFIFQDEGQQASCFYHLSKYIMEKFGPDRVTNMVFLRGSGFEEKRRNYIETIIDPIANFFHDRLNKSNSILYLLEKYKKRVEWFYRKELYNKYDLVDKGYEQILEDDLRLFLFDQGIDYPFSTPKSYSGRADLVGLINTNEPLIAEVKIFDSKKGYRKDRVFSGFSQIIKYTNDYNKDCGFLIIFNMDSSELVFNLNEEQRKFPPRVNISNKTIYFITVNLQHEYSASKIGKTKTIEIDERELFQAAKTS